MVSHNHQRNSLCHPCHPMSSQPALISAVVPYTTLVIHAVKICASSLRAKSALSSAVLEVGPLHVLTFKTKFRQRLAYTARC